MGTYFVAAVVLAAVILIIAKLARDKKKGKSACGCGCSNCPGSSVCHKNR
ncbi:FeoB-associated Cys-rich membrane protein [Ruminococcus sp. Marseille-P6503]|nr:FeoB-associated Cys-rich membrane protein [Ruminococcus sp. Marseille-P6503]